MMKAGILPALLFFSILSQAQVRRIPTPSKPRQADSTQTNMVNPGAVNAADGANAKGKEIIQQLNLSREQMLKLREIRQANLAKREAVNNNDQLTPEQKQTQLTALKKEQAQNIQAILTEEQKTKMRTLRQDAFKQKTAGADDPKN